MHTVFAPRRARLPRFWLLAACVFASLLSAARAAAQPALPYTVRTLSFNGLGTSVHGDIRSVGMGGASAGLSDTSLAAIDSPAGLAMTVGASDVHFVSDSIRDGNVQSFGTNIDTNSVGVALGLYPWALSVGYLSPYREEADYTLRPLLDPPHLIVSTREIIVSAARLFAHDRLSFGLTLVLGQAERTIELGSAKRVDQSFFSYTAGAAFGAMVRLPRRFLVSTSFGTPMHYDGASGSAEARIAIPGFFRAVEVPWRISIGLGFIPNRFFRADFTLHVLGSVDDVALVRDQAARVGRRVTPEPHIGLAYVFADFKELKATLFVGSYLELTRIADTDNRLHGTAGIEARIWIFTLGAAVDEASHYENGIVSFGADIFGILARLKVIPTGYASPRGGMFPRPWLFSDEGLARPLVHDWAPRGPDLNPITVGIGIPRNLERGLRNAGQEMKQIVEDVAKAMDATNETPETRAAADKAAAQEAAADKAAATKKQRAVDQ